MKQLSEKDLINKINIVDWKEFNGPDYYNSEEIVSALTNLARLNNECANKHSYNDVLFGVGNNHGGTYYPAIIEALPIVLQIAEWSESEIARNCSLEIVSDWYYSFDPELGSYNKISAEELGKFVRDRIRQFIERHNKVDSNRNVELIMNLTESIKDEAST